jgi:hypothetical protein
MLLLADSRVISLPLDALRITNMMNICSKKASRGHFSEDHRAQQSCDEFLEALDSEPTSGLSQAVLEQ